MLPSDFPEVQEYKHLKRLLHEQVDMQFEDLRTMLRLPKGSLTAGCSFAAASVLFNLVAGASVCFYDASLEALQSRAGRGLRFEGVLTSYYPWQEEPMGSEQVIEILWASIRNPLAHAFGFDDPSIDSNIALGKRPLTASEIRESEEATVRPGWLPPTVHQGAGDRLLLSVPTLYWGTHRMLHNLFADASQAQPANELARKLLNPI